MNFGPALCDVIPPQRLASLRRQFPRGPVAYFLADPKPKKPYGKFRRTVVEPVCTVLAWIVGFALILHASYVVGPQITQLRHAIGF